MAKNPISLPMPALIAGMRRLTESWTKRPNVTSVGIGFRERGGKRTKDLCIQVSVRRKLSPAELQTGRTAPFPKFLTIDGARIPVDVVERSYRLSHEIVPEPQGTPFSAAVSTVPAIVRRTWQPRVMPGISVAASDGLAGTLGAIVYDNASGLPCALSNAHVFLSPEGLTPGLVVQPGPNDNPNITRGALGRVLRSHIGLAADAAISSIEHRLFDPDILELNTRPARIAKAEPGDLVVMSARTSGVTRGRVSRVALTIPFNYGPPRGTVEVGAFEIEPLPGTPPGKTISRDGDSGGLWMIEENGAPTDIAVGLHFAADDPADDRPPVALACNIHSVLAKLDISFTPRP